MYMCVRVPALWRRDDWVQRWLSIVVEMKPPQRLWVVEWKAGTSSVGSGMRGDVRLLNEEGAEMVGGRESRVMARSDGTSKR